MLPENRDFGVFQSIIGVWHESLADPKKYQELALANLLKDYAKTRYGQSHHASEIENISQFRANFPIVNYRDLDPHFAEVLKGDYKAILPEPVLGWVMTRGSTGSAKVFPTTKTHIEQIYLWGKSACKLRCEKGRLWTVLRKNSQPQFPFKSPHHDRGWA
jgi:hypothetical protein